MYCGESPTTLGNVCVGARPPAESCLSTKSASRHAFCGVVGSKRTVCDFASRTFAVRQSYPLRRSWTLLCPTSERGGPRGKLGPAVSLLWVCDPQANKVIIFLISVVTIKRYQTLASIHSSTIHPQRAHNIPRHPRLKC